MRKAGGRPSLLERLCLLAFRLHPLSFQERHGREMAGTLEDALRAGGGEGEWRRLGRYLWDTLATLPGSWRDALLGAPAPRPGGGPGGWGGPVQAAGALSDMVLAVLRSLRHRPLYATVVVGTLALALGANTAIFSVTHAVLVRSLPYGAPDRVVRANPAPIGASPDMPGPWGVHPDFAAHPAVEGAAVFVTDGGANLVEGSSAGRVRVTQVEPAFFGVLGVELLLGGGLTPGGEGGAQAVLSHGVWSRASGADPDILGRRVALNGHALQVVGIAPPGVGYPAATDIWLSFPLLPELFGTAIGPGIVARLAPGVAPSAIEPVLEERVARQYANAPASLEPPPVEVVPILAELTGPVRLPLLVLTVTAGTVLLLGCLNLASLALSRVSDRTDELRVRKALGASRRRIFGELLGEVLVLTALGGAAAVAVARTGARTLVGWLPSEVPGLDTVGLSSPVLLFVLGTTVLAGLLAGTLPALWGAGTGGARWLTRGVTEGRGTARTQAWLLAVQVGLAVVLSVAAGLLGRSFQRLASVPLGYDTEHALGFRVQLPAARYPDEEAWREYADRIVERLLDLPGVSAAGATSRLPFTPGLGIGTDVRPSADAERRSASSFAASPGYFRALGIPVLEGRPFARDEPPAEDEVVVSRSLARALFGGGGAVGRMVHLPGRERQAQARVRAVVGDVRVRGRLLDGWEAAIYHDLRARPVHVPGFAVRAVGDPARLAEGVRDVLAAVDRGVPPFRLETTRYTASREIAGRTAAALLSALFGGAALLLASVGLYGLLAQGVARRRREIGLRLALGASRGDVVTLVARRGLLPTLAGTVVGLTVAFLLGDVLRGLLYETRPTDPLTYGAVAATVGAVALLANWLPALRAARLDPAEPLRQE